MSDEPLQGPCELPTPGRVWIMNPYLASRPEKEGPHMKAQVHPTWRSTYGERRIAVVYYDGAYQCHVDGSLVDTGESLRVAKARVEDYLALPETVRLEWGRE